MINTNASTHTAIERGVWSTREHDKFLDALKRYPEGPWKSIADFIGTRSTRQVQTHAQKYYEKVARRVRGLRKDRKRIVRDEHRLDDDMASLCMVLSEGLAYRKDIDAAEPALLIDTRRNLQTIAMRRRCAAASSLSHIVHSAGAVDTTDPDVDTTVEDVRSSDADNDSSLSSLEDDCLDYLL